MKVDYYGKELKVGDTILRVHFGDLQEREVIGIHKNSISLKRLKHETEICNYKWVNNNYVKTVIDYNNKPLYWHGYEKSFIIL